MKYIENVEKIDKAIPYELNDNEKNLSLNGGFRFVYESAIISFVLWQLYRNRLGTVNISQHGSKALSNKNCIITDSEQVWSWWFRQKTIIKQSISTTRPIFYQEYHQVWASMQTSRTPAILAWFRA